MAAAALSPSVDPIYETAAVATCLAGAVLSLFLATASIRLKTPHMMVLTALQFCIQCIFALHFVAMCGMQFAGVPWGFDVGLTFASFIAVALLGTAGITLALSIRVGLEPAIVAASLDLRRDRSLRAHARLLAFILARAPLLRLVTSVALVVAGAAGGHHLGMWSMRGVDGHLLTSRLNWLSFFFTAGVGGVVCTIATLAFVLVPEGPPLYATALLLTAGIAAFHYSSAFCGMGYYEADGLTTGPTMGNNAIMGFVVAAGVLGQIITAIFARLTADHHDALGEQLRVAEVVGGYITDMDLSAAKALREQIRSPSKLEETLFQIIANLELYRPYLPDTLFAAPAADVADTAVVSFAKDPTILSVEDDDEAVETSRTGSPQASTAVPCSHSMEIKTITSSGSESPKRSYLKRAPSVPVHPRFRRNLALGLLPSRLVLLRIRLLSVGSATEGLLSEVEETLKFFMEQTTAVVRHHRGTIVSCASGMMTAMWSSVQPEIAVECALAIQEACPKLVLVQVVQSGMFLAGNLAADHLRSYNVVGALDWIGLLMLRLCPGNRSHILLTTHEWASVRYTHCCLPLDRLLIHGSARTVYTVVTSRLPSAASNNEWLYAIEDIHSDPLAPLEDCWRAFIRGQFAEATERLNALGGLPAWYALHLRQLIEQAAALGLTVPVRSLEALAWCNGAPGDLSAPPSPMSPIHPFGT